MITKEEFIKFIKAYEIFENGIDRLNGILKANLWECDCIDAVSRMWDQFMYSHFTEEGCDLINWWKFEDVNHIITQTVASDLFNGKSEIEYDVNDIEDLWSYLTKFPSDYFKQNLKENKADV